MAQLARRGGAVCFHMPQIGCLFFDISRRPSQAFGGGIVTDRIKSTPELFVQLRQITMGFTKIRGSLQGLRIGRDSAAFIRSIFQYHR